MVVARHKAILSKFIVDRIHKDWIDRLYPQGWKVEKAKGRLNAGVEVGQEGRGIYMFPSPHTPTPILKFSSLFFDNS